jgi:predicted PurR-regulated permease PerM
MATPSQLLQRAAAVAGRFLLIAAAITVVGWVLWTIKLAVLPVFVAALLCTALAPLVVRLERRGWPTLGATWLVFGGFLLLLAAIALVIIPPTAAELGDVGDSVRDGVQEVEDWLVDGPLDLDRAQVEEFTDDPMEKASDFVQSADLPITTGALVVGEVLAGSLLTFVLTFLLLKDGRRFQAWALAHLPAHHREPVRAGAGRVWEALGGYLRGAAILGSVEGVIVGIAVWAVGGALAIPVAVLTFVSAFFPIVGAVFAGIVATLVVLATAGPTEALIVLVIVVIVQQLDGDILAPFIFGRSVRLNPAVILVALTAGGAAGGIVGAFLAVPLAATVSAVFAEVWERRGERWLADADAHAEADGEAGDTGGDGTASGTVSTPELS